MGGAVSSIVSPITSLVSSKPSAPSTPAPSTAEVSQATSTSATEVVKKRRRGKSPTILTTSAGAEGSPTLSTTSLFGQ